MSRFPQDLPRYPPQRDRSRSPQRFDRRPSGQFNPAYAGRNTDFARGPEAPRGPRGFNEPPIGPRGRGIPPPAGYAELRNAPPLGTARDRPSFRERDFDRRGRPPSPPPRIRSPLRPYRDAPSPREIDMNRPRRDSRDGPISAAPAYNDSPPFPSPAYGRGGFVARGRGRGRGDFDRGRRPPHFDERSSFRPRSPPPVRGPRDSSRGEWEDRRIERRPDERWPERDDREPDRFRRDPIPPSRFDSRSAGEATPRSLTPHQPIQAPPPPPPFERPQPDLQRDDNAPRRMSSAGFTPQNKEQRRDPPPQNELLAGRAEAFNNRYNARSPPPAQAPSVPAFGSVSLKPPSFSGPTSNVWKASQESRRPASPPRAPSPAQKLIPVGPKAQTAAAPPAALAAASSIVPPAAPKALRGPEGAPSGPATRPTIPSSVPIPTAPAALRNEDRSAQLAQAPFQRDVRATSGPFTASTPTASNAPWSIAQAQRPSRAASVEPSRSQQPPESDRRPPVQTTTTDSRFAKPEVPAQRAGTPPLSAPSAPRNSSFSVSPRLHGVNPPTAPKADRIPPSAPKAPAGGLHNPPSRFVERASSISQRAPPTAPKGPMWNQWIRPGPPPYRDTILPAKRDANGDEKDQQGRSHPSPQPGSATLNTAMSAERTEVKADRPPSRQPSFTMNQTRQPRDAPENFSPMAPTAKVENMRQETTSHPKSEIDAVGDPVDAVMSDDSSEDDIMDLDDADIESTMAKFEQKNARLQNQLVDLSGRQYRATTPLEHIARLANVTSRDIPLFDELQREQDTPSLEEEDRSMVSQDPDEEQRLLTPKEEDAEEDVEMEGSDALDQALPPPPPMRKQSPEVINLPYLLKSSSTSVGDTVQGYAPRQDTTTAAVLAELSRQQEDDAEYEEQMMKEYLQKVHSFKEVFRHMDDVRDEREKAEREKSADPASDVDPSSIPIEVPVNENSRTRLHKFSSEYDIARVLKESEETARIEQEKLDREAKSQRDAMEKEAITPEMMDQELQVRRAFVNTNSFRDADSLTRIYGYAPPADDFTEEEHRTFLEAFKDRPKKWGEIASLLPGRTYQHCIHHYYAFKWDGRFRETKGKRRGKMPRAKTTKAPTRSRGAALMADLSRSEDFVATAGASGPPGVSETGRPKRAAARTTYTDKDAESKAGAVAATPGKRPPKGEGSGEGGSEKPVKRRKAAAGERVPKKPKAQPLAAAPVEGSPFKVERDVQFRTSDLTREEIARVEEASLLAGLQTSYNRVQAEVVPMYANEGFMQSTPTVEGNERSRPAGQLTQQRSSASSYWSVPEQQDFMKFIGHFGTDFGAIASHMGTKTQTMVGNRQNTLNCYPTHPSQVKNYYQRHVESGSRQDLVDTAETANKRRERGEDMGIPPTPTPIVKRRYDNPHPSGPRTLAPHTDAMEIEESSATSNVPSIMAQQSRFPVTAQSTPAASRAAPEQSQSAQSSAPVKQQHPGVRPAQPPGPKMGFFTEPRNDQRPSMPLFPPTAPRPALQIHQPGHQSQSSIQSGRTEPTPPVLTHVQREQQQARIPPEAQDPTSEWRKELIREQERAKNLLREHERLSSEHVPQLQPQHPLYAQLAPQPPPQGTPPTGGMDRKPIMDDRAPTPTLPAVPPARPTQGFNMRSILGSPVPTASAPPPLQQPLHYPGPDPSPTKITGFRPSSVPAVSPAQPPSLKPPTPEEPRKRSNLASLLNSEPEEPRPQKRVSDHNVPPIINRMQSPAPPVRNSTPASQSSSVPPHRREVFGHPSAPRSAYERTSISSQPPTHAPTPPPKQEVPYWQTMSSARQRDDWAPRAPTTQPPHANSPHPAPLEREVRPYFSHRASVFGPMNAQSRSNPSPPPNPHAYSSHSRTPSYTQQGPPQHSQRPGTQHMQHQQQHSQGQQPGQILQPNPYAQPPGPAPHLQQMQTHQQNQMHHSHNTPLGYGGHPGVHSRQTSREDEMTRELGERERAYLVREEQQKELEAHYRAQAQQEQQQQDQQRFARPPPHPLQMQAHPGPPTPYSSDRASGSRIRQQANLEVNAAVRRMEMEQQSRAEYDRREAEMNEGRRRMEAQLRADGATVSRSNQENGYPPRRR